MPPIILKETGEITGTLLHPIIAVLVIVAFVLIIIMNIRHSIIMMVFFSILIPLVQKVQVFNFNFTVFRLLLLAGWIKILFFSNLTLGKLEKTDKTIIYWVIISFIAYIIQQYNVDAVINRLGFAYNAIGTYFLYRIIIQRKENISTLINTLAVVSAIIAILMVNEQWTGKNMLYLLGGVNEFSEVRYGSVRSQGPFSHSIVAGIFGAMMFPLFFSMWRYKWGNAFFGILGTLSACVLVITCSSSGPIIAGISGFIALLFWPLRNQMRKVQYSIIFIVVVYQVITINPVWALISEFTVIKGSTGFHRYMLVNSLIEHFSEWFLLGTTSTAYWGLGMEDRVNQYYLEAVNGGFLKLTLFILIIIYNFNIISNKIKSTKNIFIQKKFWALGSALFANLVGFLGISYWDQMLYIWYLFLALITSTYLIYGGKNLMVEQNKNQF